MTINRLYVEKQFGKAVKKATRFDTKTIDFDFYGQQYRILSEKEFDISEAIASSYRSKKPVIKQIKLTGINRKTGENLGELTALLSCRGGKGNVYFVLSDEMMEKIGRDMDSFCKKLHA